MDVHELRGLMTAVILLTYLGIFAWAWWGGPNRFRDAALLPFADDPAEPGDRDPDGENHR